MSKIISIYGMLKKCFLLLLPVLLVFGCKNQISQQNLNRITELENILAEAEDNLAYDEVELKQRLDSMQLKLSYIKKNAKDSGSDEMRNAMIRYAAISSNYMVFLDELPVAMYDLEQYKSSFNELRESLLHHKISEKEFEKAYADLKPKLVGFERKTRALAYNTFSIEGEYMRYNEIVTKRYEMLKQ